MKPQHFVHRPTPVKAFQLTASFRDPLLTQLPDSQREPVEIKFNDVGTGAFLNPLTKIVTVPKGKGTYHTLRIDRWFIYEQDGEQQHLVVNEDRFHSLYQPAADHEITHLEVAA